MLKGIDARLNAEILWTLRAMGHGDTLAIVDANFPAESVARATVSGQLLRMDAATAADAVAAVLTLMPLDTFVDDFAATMQRVGDADAVPAAVADIQAAVDAAEGTARPVPSVERFAFYDLARSAFAVLQTLETRPYGNIVLRKGVLLSEAP